jgi:hypothetical protein
MLETPGLKHGEGIDLLYVRTPVEYKTPVENKTPVEYKTAVESEIHFLSLFSLFLTRFLTFFGPDPWAGFPGALPRRIRPRSTSSDSITSISLGLYFPTILGSTPMHYSLFISFSPPDKALSLSASSFLSFSEPGKTLRTLTFS